MIGIIAAMPEEVAELIKTAGEAETQLIGRQKFILTKIGTQDVVISQCGIGKTSAAICAATMINCFHPSLIINIGIAGSLKKEIGLLDVVIGDKFVQHDMDTTALGDERGYLSNLNTVFIKASPKSKDIIKHIDCKYHVGTVASGDKFIYLQSDIDDIAKSFNAIACDMEGAAIAHACALFDTGFIMLRSISDGGSEIDFNKFKLQAAAQSTRIIIRYLTDLA